MRFRGFGRFAVDVLTFADGEVNGAPPPLSFFLCEKGLRILLILIFGSSVIGPPPLPSFLPRLVGRLTFMIRNEMALALWCSWYVGEKMDGVEASAQC